MYTATVGIIAKTAGVYGVVTACEEHEHINK